MITCWSVNKGPGHTRMHHGPSMGRLYEIADWGTCPAPLLQRRAFKGQGTTMGEAGLPSNRARVEAAMLVEVVLSPCHAAECSLACELGDA